MPKVSFSQSQKIGLAFKYDIELTDEIKPRVDKITSLFSSTPLKIKETCNADDPFIVEKEYLELQNSFILFSKIFVYFP